MISRAAESCFWLMRNWERLESMARILSVNSLFILDVKMKAEERWWPLIIVAGEDKRFLRLYGKTAIVDGEIIQDYLTWDERNPVSIFSCLRQARENACTIRDTLSLEMWEVLNSFWLWITGDRSRSLYQQDRVTFYDIIKSHCQMFHGLYYSSMLQDEPFNFMRLGMVLERANQTARIMDVKYYRLSLEQPTEREFALETIYWLTLLKYCSASDSYVRRHHYELNRRQVAEFLLLEETFPRSIRYCISDASQCLERLMLQSDMKYGWQSKVMLANLMKKLGRSSFDALFRADIHYVLTTIVNETMEVCESIGQDFFNYNGVSKGGNGVKKYESVISDIL